MNGRFRASWVIAVAVVGLALVIPATQAGATDGPSVVISDPVVGQFFANPTNAGSFTATPSTDVVFSQDFPVVNFNPPAGGDACDPPVDEFTRPFTNVDPAGGCVPAEGEGAQAGVGDLTDFDAVFTTSLTVDGPGAVSFGVHSDDGWIMGVGPGTADEGQPTFPPSNPMVNVYTYGGVTPFRFYPIVGAYNIPTSPSDSTVEVDFPAAGTYPVEFDYAECCSGQLTFTLQANGSTVGHELLADLGIDQSASPTSGPGGTSVVFTSTVTNDGPSGATGVVVTETLPSGAVFDPTTSDASCSLSTPPSIVTCDVGSLANGSSVTVAVGAAMPCTSGSVDTVASVAGDQTDPNGSNDSSTTSVDLTTPCVGTTGGVTNGGTVTTDPGGTGPDPDSGVWETSSLTAPAGVSGQVSITLSVASSLAPSETCPAFGDLIATTDQPAATANKPLQLVFTFAACTVPPRKNINRTTIQISSDGVSYTPLRWCRTIQKPKAYPDPCVFAKNALSNGQWQYVVEWSGQGDPSWRPR